MQKPTRINGLGRLSAIAKSLGARCDATALATLLLTFASLEPIVRAQAPADRVGNVRVELSDDDHFALPVDARLAEDIEAAADQLGAPLFAKREAASQRLVEIGASAFAKLRELYRATPDIEVRMRIEDVIQTAYYNYQVFDGNGFLGVQMRPYPGPGTTKNALPDGVSGVFVTQIIPDTGAARAGVQEKDIIVGIDKEALTGAGNTVLNQLSAAIRSYRPGSSIALTVVREEQEVAINVILGRCPERQARAGAVRGTSDLYRQAATRFPSWWLENFKAPAATDGRASSR